MRVAAISGLVLVILGVHASLFWIEHQPAERLLNGDENRYVRAAAEFSAGRDPELSLLWPPLYPRLLAPLLAINGGRVLVEVAQTLLLLVAAWALAGIGRSLFSAEVGILAAGFLLIYPPMVAYGHYLWPEVLHLALFLVSLWILVDRPATWRWLATAGVLLGLALSTKSILGAFLPCLLLPLLAANPGSERWRPRLARVAVVLLALLATVAPTLVDHWRRYGEPTIANSGPFNLAIGLADDSRRNLEDEDVGGSYRRYIASAETPSGRNQKVWREIQQRLASQGWAATVAAQLGRQYFRLFDRRTFLDDMLPGGAIATRGRGYVEVPGWLARTLSGWSHLLYAALLLLATAGIASLHKPAQWVRVLLAFVGYNLVLFLGLHVKTRYRLQFEPVLALFAAQAIVNTGLLRARLRRPGFALALAASMATVLMLAFGLS